MISRRAWLVGTTALVGCGTAPAPRVAAPGRVEGVEAAALRAFAAASLAPSRHNEQPWIVTARPDGRFALSVDESRRLSAVDPRGIAAEIALGAFAEALVRAAPSVGLRASEEPGRVFSLSASSTKGGSSDADALLARATTREPFEGATPAELEAVAGGDPAVLVATRGSREHATLTDFTRRGASLQLAREAAADELGKFLHLDDDEAREARDGYTLAVFGVGGWNAWAIRRFVGKGLVRHPRFKTESEARMQTLVRETPAFVALFGEPFAVGRAYLGLALRAEASGLGVHPVQQALEEGLGADLETALGRKDPALLLRVGRAKGASRPRTLRRDVASFLRREAT